MIVHFNQPRLGTPEFESSPQPLQSRSGASPRRIAASESLPPRPCARAPPEEI